MLVQIVVNDFFRPQVFLNGLFVILQSLKMSELLDFLIAFEVESDRNNQNNNRVGKSIAFCFCAPDFGGWYSWNDWLGIVLVIVAVIWSVMESLLLITLCSVPPVILWFVKYNCFLDCSIFMAIFFLCFSSLMLNFMFSCAMLGYIIWSRPYFL